jgi:1-deoxyxylulose-5-phosphate synthase
MNTSEGDSELEHVNLGRSGLKVSRIALGCMSFGLRPQRWRLGESDSMPIIQHALDLGINFFDTADMYGQGESEILLGRTLNAVASREEVVIATKLFYPVRPGPNGSGLSRKAVFASIDASLQRLGTDYVDLYQIHRWDEETPIEETLEALHDVVKAGKARYIGASSMSAWQFAKALFVADRHDWTRFVSMQPHYNLLNREEEREMLPLCRAEGIGVLPWSPLARGRLARDRGAESNRARQDETADVLYNAYSEADGRVVDAVGRVADRHSTTRSRVALAWLLAQSGVTAPVVGATMRHHVSEAVAALELKLAPNDFATLEEGYIAHPWSFYRDEAERSYTLPS